MRLRFFRLPLLLSLVVLVGCLVAAAYLPAKRAISKSAVERALRAQEDAKPKPTSAPGAPPAAKSPEQEPASAQSLPAAGIGTVSLRFEIRDAETGELLPEVSYTIGAMDDGGKAEPVTAGGEYEFPAPHEWGHFYFVISSPGHDTKGWHLPLPQQEESLLIEKKLGKGLNVRGQVVDEDGGPVAGVEVHFNTTGAWGNEDRMATSFDATTGADGWWSADGISSDSSSAYMSLKHPDFAQDVEDRSIKIEDLAAKPQVLVRGKELRGRVTGPDGEPVAGATLSYWRSHKVETQTDADGTFVFAHASPDYFANRTLSITAKGYATLYRETTPADEGAEMQLSLAKGQPLVLRLLDPEGRPLSHARTFFSIGTAFDSQAHYFDLTADAAGVVTVEDAPQEMNWSITPSSEGQGAFASHKEEALRVDATPRDIRFGRLPRASILPRDAMTGEPLKSYRVTKGTGSWDSGNRRWWERLLEVKKVAADIHWSDYQRETASGVYQAYYDADQGEPLFYRIEADGYYPSQTEQFPGKGDAYFVLSMVRGDPVVVRPVTAQGNVATRVRAGWAPLDKSIGVSNGKPWFSSWLEAMEAQPDGTMRLLPVERQRYALVILAEEGAAIVAGNLVRSAQDITLTAWGGIAGEAPPEVVAVGNKGFATRQRAEMAGLKVGFDGEDESAVEGRFEIRKLYPGDYWVGPQIERRESFGYLHTTFPWTNVTVKPGEVTQVRLEGGRSIKGQLEMPPEAWEWFRKGGLKIAVRRADVDTGERWREDAILDASETGALSFPALPPGKYALEDMYLLNPDEPRGGQRIKYFIANTEFTVPTVGEGPVDIGTLQVESNEESEDAKPLGTGAAAPAIEASTLDGQPFSLEALKGKVVVLDFWATWCGPCVEEMPTLKEVWEEFGARDDFAMVSLSLDDDKEAAAKFVKENGLAWGQVALGGWFNKTTQAYRVRGIPHILVIGRDGLIAAEHLRGGETARAVRRALGG